MFDRRLRSVSALVPFVVCAVSGVAAGYDSATPHIDVDEHSLCMPSGPPPVDGYEDYDAAAKALGQTVIPGVPGYQWRHGCGPTAAGMVIGYWDSLGYSALIPGDAYAQTSAVNDAIATGDGAGTHYADYSLPIDNSGTGLLEDASYYGGAHSSDCLADFMLTSWYSMGLYYGWSYGSQVDDAFVDYVDYVNLTYSKTYAVDSYDESWGAFTWPKYVAEIDAGRPVVLLVDTDGDGSTDHFVTAIGYRDTSGYNEYACLDTWAPPSSIRWERFQERSVGIAWGIAMATYFSITEIDCNGNEIDDPCDIDCGLPDCNVPGCGQSLDCNNNGFPDECEEPDCNGNEVPDECDLVGNDCNNDQIPDDCQLAGNDCNANLTPDECDVATLEATIASPANQHPCPAGTAVFSLSYAGSASYQWYADGMLLSDGGDVSGALTDTLTIQNVDAADETDYYCEVTDGCITGNSQTASLTIVPSMISITQQPMTQVTICTSSGQGAAFQLAVDDPIAVTYQWSKDGAPLTNDARISGATTNRVEISPVEPGDLGFYTCHAENPCGGSVDTDPARGELVVADPVYTQQPQDAFASIGDYATFTVTVLPANTLLFWYMDGAQLSDGVDANGMLIAGASTDMLALWHMPEIYDGSQFHVVGFNPNPVCQADSDVATLHLSSQAPCAPTDVNCDGTTDVLDLGVVRQGANWNQSPPTGTLRADINSDGVADILDLGVIRQGANWNTSTGPCDCP